MATSHVLLLTGKPGIGKTTVMRRVAAALAPRRIGGFLTDEIREGGARVGFRIVPFGGPARVMAHVGRGGAARVGRYGVDVAMIDAVAAEALAPSPSIDLYLVDEIGRMECLSRRFVAAMRVLLDSDRRVIATVALRGEGFIAEVKRRRDVELREVTLRDRDALPGAILEWLRE